jgi:NhaA family Na+:H+ antiporter
LYRRPVIDGTFIQFKGHPAIDYLLLLAVADDALGMVIIAIFYTDPSSPVQPQWLL